MTAAVGVLAAGASSRMRGRDKLLEEVGGVPLLARQIGIAMAACDTVFVALAPGPGRRRDIVLASGASPVDVAENTGIGASIAAVAGAADRAGASALMIVLADMPELEAGDLGALLAAAAAAPSAVVRAGAADGRPGHPVVFPRRCFDALRRLSGDTGARAVIAAGPVRIVPLAGTRALTDLDTPEDWHAWRTGAAPRDGA